MPIHELGGPLGALLKGLSSIRHTGPAPDHKSKPFLPLKDMLKPGPHPAHLAKKDEKKKDKDHKEATSSKLSHHMEKDSKHSTKPVKII
jgi:hypothetical protein